MRSDSIVAQFVFIFLYNYEYFGRSFAGLFVCGTDQGIEIEFY